jgi:Ca-activated chloride channel family protein
MIAPLALIGLIALPIIVAFYMLRLRRRDLPVGSTFLWQQLVRDVEANAPWQKLRFSWLLLVQLLIALIIVLAATRPFSTVASDLAANVVLIVDTSASMGARDPEGDRIELARQAAREVVGRLPQGGRITVVAADDSARVLASETDDRAAALDAIDTITATQLPGDLTDAFALASALARRDADSTVVVVTDATEDELPRVGIGVPVQVELVGSGDTNQAIAALSALRRSAGAQLDLFVAVANYGSTDVTRRLEIYADGELADARDLTIPAGQRSEALVASVPSSASQLEARLDGEDALAVDDRAFALIPADRRVRALVVGDGNTYLEHALALLPRLELYAVGEDGYAEALDDADAADQPYGLIVFNGVVPAEPPDVPALYVDPATDGAFGTVAGRVEAPGIERTDPDEPLLRFVDLTTVHLGRARQIELADGVTPIVETSAGSPLVAVGQVDSRRLALIGFALAESDLPLQVAFPLLMSNLVDYLAPPGDGLLPISMRLGEAVSVDVDDRLATVQLVEYGQPDLAGDGGSFRSDLPVVDGEVTVPAARWVGVRELWAEGVLPDGTDVPELGGRIGQTAANLFAPDESAVAPGDPRRIAEMGSTDPRAETATQQARAEWWWPLALAALTLLAVEWILFHRPTRRAAERLIRRWRSGPTPAGWRAR